MAHQYSFNNKPYINRISMVTGIAMEWLESHEVSEFTLNIELARQCLDLWFGYRALKYQNLKEGDLNIPKLEELTSAFEYLRSDGIVH